MNSALYEKVNQMPSYHLGKSGVLLMLCLFGHWAQSLFLSPVKSVRCLDGVDGLKKGTVNLASQRTMPRLFGISLGVIWI